MAQGIYAQCFFVCAEAPSESLIETGRGQHVTVLSHEQLEQRFFDYHKYHFVRSSKRFGSAVDPYSGEKDERPYIRVHYEDVNRLRRYTISDLIRLVLNGKRIILLGNYGTGKSRCVQELFSEAASFAGKRHVYPLAIDLRENWGLRRSGEIVRRHFDDLGLSQHADAIVKVLETGAVCLLMDGFDEIVSQVWSDDAIHLEAIRKESLSGVRDLISRVRGGVLITGREHYFNSEQEMVECLGFHPDYTISCAEEFSADEMAEYLAGKTPGLAIPKWLPRRPLISQLLARLEAEALTELLKEPGGETKFWYSLLDAICIREAQIHPSLSPDTIRGVLLEIAHASREKPQNFGPITLSAMNEAFERVVGRPPRDEASAMLQRLPMLGRVEAETSDRQFLDSYILDGLRATSLLSG